MTDLPPGAHILESTFKEHLRRALCAPGRLTRVWVINVGQVVTRDRAGRRTGRFSAGSVVGAADLSGLAGPNGVRLEVEVKVDHEWTEEQIAFCGLITRLGGVYVLVRYCHKLSLVDNVVAGVAKVDEAILKRT